MLIYPVSFQRWRVIPEGNPTLTGLMFVRRSGAAKLPPGKGDPQSSQNRVMPDNRKQTPKRLDGGSGVLDNACRTEGAFTPLNPTGLGDQPLNRVTPTHLLRRVVTQKGALLLATCNASATREGL